MTNAYLAAKTDMSIRRAAQQYGVPFQTLRDRIAGDIDLECCTMGAIPLFSLGEEARLVSHLKEMGTLILLLEHKQDLSEININSELKHVNLIYVINIFVCMCV
jgi:NAD-dependent oxidoreductase involved in siderophore biosynthesis